MPNRTINPTGVSYAQAHLVEAPTRWLFVSGQIPVDEKDEVPAGFEDQCRLVWHNIEKQILAGGMTLQDLVKVTVFLSDRRYREANYKVRHAVLSGQSTALTIIIAGGDWGEPQRLPEPVNSPAAELLPRADSPAAAFISDRAARAARAAATSMSRPKSGRANGRSQTLARRSAPEPMSMKRRFRATERR